MVASNKAQVAAAITMHAERHRTIRYGMLVGGMVAGVWAIAWAAVKIADTSWPKVAAIAAAALVPASAVGIMWRSIVAMVRRMVLRFGDRMAKLEQVQHPARTSSGLAADGSDPIEGRA